ncbi:hypothetical protein BC938DRAFT_478228 [Jimgerdemannia flammicorona]|uniref:WWE domain-containing protein n=1 Tax=Jimgerdemannia flammicorona TaxID=994334 RepID=A0A433QN85_9FUNG|nr:hypothetical protein BC938DRAFT_478228 [Jimgerdemannia flammicorona]
MPTRTIQPPTATWSYFDHPDWIPFSPWQCALIERSFQDAFTLWVDIELSTVDGSGNVVTIYFEDRDSSSMYLARYDTHAECTITHSVRRLAYDEGFEKEEMRFVYAEENNKPVRKERKFPKKLQQSLFFGLCPWLIPFASTLTKMLD